MAITQTTTRAITQTVTRNICIQNQFKTAFRRLMGYSSEKYQRYMDAIAEHKIDHIDFWAYSYDSSGNREKWIQLTLSVDWKKHNNYLIKGEEIIELKKDWNGIVPEIDIAIEEVETFVDANHLTPTFSVGFVPDISNAEHNMYMKKLGLVSGKFVPWKDGSQLVSLYKKCPREVPELTAELKVANKLL